MSWSEAFRRASKAVLYQIGWAVASSFIVAIGVGVIGTTDEASNGQWAVGGLLVILGSVLFTLSFIAVGLKVLTVSISDHIVR